MQLECWPGRSYPLGATVYPSRTNFSLFSRAPVPSNCCSLTIRRRASSASARLAGAAPVSHLLLLAPLCLTSGTGSSTATVSAAL